MISRRGWRLVRILVLGMSLTAAVAVIDHAGELDTLEHFTYDQRLRYFQHWFARPTDTLVHVLIDDQSVGQIGPWPWSRSTVADIIDEAVRDQAGQLAFDIMWSSPVHPDVPPGGLAPRSADARLAQSIAAAVSAGVPVLLPVSLNLDPSRPDDPVLQNATDILTAHPETSTTVLAEKLHVSVNAVETTYYSPALTTALPATARKVVTSTTLSDAEAVARYFPDATSRGETNPQVRLFQTALQDARIAAEIEQTWPAAGAPIGLLKARFAEAPIAALTSVTPCFGYVNYLVGNDGRVRTVPLVVQEHDHLVPQFGVMIAAMRLGIDVLDPKQMQISANALVLRPPDGPEIRVPVRVAETGIPPRPVAALMDISFRGGADWKHLYDPWPFTDAFIPMLEIWQVANQQGMLDARLARLETDARAIIRTLDPNDPAGAAAANSDPAARIALGKHALQVASKNGASPAEAIQYFDDQKKLSDKDRDPPSDNGRVLMATVVNLNKALAQVPLLQRNVDEIRVPLVRKLKGKMLLFGFAETSSVADHVPTSIHPDCPGVVIHGAIANAILTGELWTHLAPRYAALLTIVCGILVTLAVALLTPWRAFFVWISLMTAVAGISSVVLFDYANIVIGMAGPLTAGTFCWAACTLVVTLRERLDRALVTRRFRSYVDPALVNYVIEHPEQAHLRGETRELTVVFLDVAGFTTLTEKLGEKSIVILRELMDAIVPIIRRHGGFVNKFLGDGVMFFYGAPQHDPDHAKHAIQTVLEMQQALGKVNAKLVAAGLPQLGVRAGISTGTMVVGDAGSADASDYTVLGDAVNLGARLESANKALGTVALCTARTAELCGDAFLFVPLGRVLVVGKEQPVLVCEPVCALAEASAEQHACADTLKRVWNHMTAREVRDAVAHLDALRATGTRTKICELLQQLMDDLQAEPDRADVFIRLTGK